MLKPVKMQKVRVVAVRQIATPLLQELHNLGMVEVRRTSLKDFGTGKTIPIYDKISEQWVKLRGIKTMLGLHGGEYEEMDVEKAVQEASQIQISGELQKDLDRLNELNSDLSALEAKLRSARKLASFRNVDFSLSASKYIVLYAGTVATSRLASLRKSLPKCEMSVSLGKAESTVLVMCRNREEETAAVELTLSRHGFSPIETAGFTTPMETIRNFESQASAKKAEIAGIREHISAYSSKYGEQVKRLERTLAVWAERGMLTKDFSFGKDSLILEGWVKAHEYGKLEGALEAKFPKKVFLEKIEGKGPPTVLENPKSTTQFQFLVEMFSLPRPDEIDPSLILLITVPIMYGLMLGDVFYGLISFLLMGWVLKKVKPGGLGFEIARVWKFSAIAAIIFGFIFDEWMGLSHFQWLELFQNWGIVSLASLGVTHPLYYGFSRIHNVSLLLAFSIILGLIHLAFGFLLGAINEWHHNRKHAYGKLGWIGLELGGFLLITVYMFSLFPAFWGEFGAAIFIFSLVVILYTEGMIGAVELPGILGNALSYARIAAVGIAGVALAEVINESFIPEPTQGLMVLLILPLFIVLHTLNTGLAMVESIVQGGRLNLVEFYSKFFHGGGKAFTPFSVQKYKQ